MPLIPWRPITIYGVDADTGKPVDQNATPRPRTAYVGVNKDANGKRKLVLHRQSKTTVASKDEKPTGDSKVEVKKDEAAAKQPEAEKDPDAWSAEDDEKLIAMKAPRAPHKTWTECGEALGGRHKTAVSKRYRELEKEGKVAKAEPKTDAKQVEAQKDKKAHDAKKDENQKQKQKQKQDNNGKKKQEQNDKQGRGKQKEERKQQAEASKPVKPVRPVKPVKAPSASGSKAEDEAKFTMGEWQTLQEDETFSFGELQCLSELIAKDQSQSWLRISSRFYDLTQRRVSPEDIRDKFQQIGTAR